MVALDHVHVPLIPLWKVSYHLDHFEVIGTKYIILIRCFFLYDNIV